MGMRGSSIRLLFSNVLVSTAEELYFRVTVDLGGVQDIKPDYKPVTEVGVEGEDPA